MRLVVSAFVWFAVLVSGGCAIFEKETTNRGGYLDYLVDEHWLKADSKGMRALRAFAIQVSLARVASVSAKNDSDRQLLAIRIGALTKRFLPIYACAFNTNPLGVAGAEKDPCFYYDSAMVEYTTGLFDLAMIALPLEDGKKLVNAVAGSFVNPINLADLLNTLLAIGKDALKYGRVVGALYRDTVELEVQLWLATPSIDDRPPPYQVTTADVAELRSIYDRRNDDMPAWLSAIAALRSRGLEPLPHPKFFGELGGLMNYLCDLITNEPAASTSCKVGLPTTIPPPTAVLQPTLPMRVSATVTTNGSGPAVKVSVSRPASGSGQQGTISPSKTSVEISGLQAQFDSVKAEIGERTKNLNDMNAAFGQLPKDSPARNELRNNINDAVKELAKLNQQAQSLQKQASPAKLK